MNTLTRAELRQRIDLLEALDGVMSAIDDTSGVEFAPGESGLLNLRINARDTKESSVAFAYGLTPEVVLAGLQAMRQMLQEQLNDGSEA